MSNMDTYDDDAKALQDAINDAPGLGDDEQVTEDPIPVKPKKKSSGALILGGAAVVVLGMGGFFAYTEMSKSSTPVVKAKPQAPMLADAPASPGVSSTPQLPASLSSEPTSGSVPAVAPGSELPKSEPPKVKDDPFNSKPVDAVLPDTKPVDVKPVDVKPVDVKPVKKDKSSFLVADEKESKPVVVKKHTKKKVITPKAPVENGYNRII